MCEGYWPNTVGVECHGKMHGHPVKSATYIAVEVKPADWRPRNRREELRHLAQQEYLARVRRAGGLAWVISGPEDVARVLAP